MTQEGISNKPFLGAIYKNPANDKLYLTTSIFKHQFGSVCKWYLLDIDNKKIYQDYNEKFEFTFEELYYFLRHHNWKLQTGLVWNLSNEFEKSS